LEADRIVIVVRPNQPYRVKQQYGGFMNSLKSLLVCGALALSMTTTMNAVTVDLAPPGLAPYVGQDIGNAQIGTAFRANSTFSVDSIGIKMNPFGNSTSQPKTAELDVYIYSVIGGARGSLLKTASYCVGGACPQNSLLPSNANSAVTFFLDVPITFTFQAGETYLVEFNVKPNGWGEGLAAKNSVEFFRFDPRNPNQPPNKSGTPFTVGPVTVLDGVFNDDFLNENFTHIRFNQTACDCVPRTDDLAPPGLSSFVGQDIGDAQIGGSFRANSSFTISAAGIKFNPFGNVSSQPKTAELDVYIYSVTGGARGGLLASASYCVGGLCPQPTLLPSSGYPGAPFFIDVPINFTFVAGQTYLVEFNVKPNGWGYGLTAKNSVEFFRFDPRNSNQPPFKSGAPFTVGPVTVLDGAFNADFLNENFVHMRLIEKCDCP
jgi:hypothetical protein